MLSAEARSTIGFPRRHMRAKAKRCTSANTKDMTYPLAEVLVGVLDMLGLRHIVLVPELAPLAQLLVIVSPKTLALHSDWLPCCIASGLR